MASATARLLLGGSAAAAAVATFPRRFGHAESEHQNFLDQKSPSSRINMSSHYKPIYDTINPAFSIKLQDSPSADLAQEDSGSHGISDLLPYREGVLPESAQSHQKSLSSAPKITRPPRITFTDRLASHLKTYRLSAYGHVSRFEDSFDNSLTHLFQLERSFLSKIRSLAPPPSSGELVGPGLLTVALGSMAASIAVHRRNILIRVITPPMAALVTAFTVLPVTMSNVERLLLDWENVRYPAFYSRHQAARERMQQFLETGKAHSQASAEILAYKIHNFRKCTLNWLETGN